MKEKVRGSQKEGRRDRNRDWKEMERGKGIFIEGKVRRKSL